MKKGEKIPTADGVAVYCAFAELASTAKQKAHPKNYNEHPPEQVKLMLKIIQGNGWRRSIVVSNRSGFITKGHCAWMAAQLGKLKQVPIDYQDYASEEDELKDLAADNELARLAVRDESRLQEIVNQLAGAKIDTELAGILDQLEQKPELHALATEPVPPKMAWVLIGIPLVDYGKVNGAIEALAKIPEVVMESTCNDYSPAKI